MPRKAKPLPQVDGAPAAPAGPSVGVTPPMPAQPTPGRPPRQPVRAPTGMGYGERQAVETAQRGAPLPQAQPVVPPPVNPRRQMQEQAIQAAQAMPFDAAPLGAPSERPHEPLTAGVAVGRGPGPEVLGFSSQSRVASTLSAIAKATGDSEIAALAEIAGTQGA